LFDSFTGSRLACLENPKEDEKLISPGGRIADPCSHSSNRLPLTKS
jgi:hypothetical protein